MGLNRTSFKLELIDVLQLLLNLEVSLVCYSLTCTNWRVEMELFQIGIRVCLEVNLW
jgi:hypothetical protein